MLESSFHETQVLLRAAAAGRTPLLLTSTSEVYGKSAKPEFGEDDDLLIGPPGQSRWSYACSKLTDEFLALAYAREKNLPVIIVRLFNTVGPRQTGRYGMVLPRFIAAAQRNEPLKVFGDGGQTRCFCHVVMRWRRWCGCNIVRRRAAKFSTSAARRKSASWNWRGWWSKRWARSQDSARAVRQGLRPVPRARE